MKKILYLILRRDMIRKMEGAYCGNQFIDGVLNIFGLRETGLPKFKNPPPPPEPEDTSWPTVDTSH